MSNWSTVIITWSSIDDEVQGKQAQYSRAFAIQSKLRSLFGCRPEIKVIKTEGPHEGKVSAWSPMVIFMVNHFDPDDLVKILLDFDWELPDEVEIIHRQEETGFQVTRMMGSA